MFWCDIQMTKDLYYWSIQKKYKEMRQIEKKSMLSLREDNTLKPLWIEPLIDLVHYISLLVICIYPAYRAFLLGHAHVMKTLIEWTTYLQRAPIWFGSSSQSSRCSWFLIWFVNSTSNGRAKIVPHNLSNKKVAKER